MTTLITRQELWDLVASDAEFTLIDALPREYYDQRHLPGALNLIEAEAEALADQLLPDKSAAIVTYCSNAACGNSQAVASRLERLGYTNVRKYRDGIEDWVAAGLPTESTSVLCE